MRLCHKWWKPDPEDAKQLERAKESKATLEQLHQDLIELHGQAKVLSKNLREGREDNHYGQAVMNAFKPKAPKSEQ